MVGLIPYRKLTLAVHAVDQDAEGVNVGLERFNFKPIINAPGSGVVVDGMVAGTTEAATDAPSSPTSSEMSPLQHQAIRASYVVGCDGANSTVRRLQGFTMTDLNFENDWLIADLLLRDGYVPPRFKKIGASQICDPNRPTTVVFAGKGRKRIEFMRLPGETQADLLEDGKVWTLLADWGFTPDNCMLERKVIYTFKARWSNEFFKGRVMLAGDALHQMPPFIGQGLNSGFRDAGALAWRLPLILKGLARPSRLMQSYQNERLEHICKITVSAAYVIGS